MKRVILLSAFVFIFLNLNAQLIYKESVDFWEENLNRSTIGLDFQNDTILSYETKNGNLQLRFYKSGTLISKQEFTLRKYFSKNNSEYNPMCLFQNGTLGVLCGNQLLVANLDSNQKVKTAVVKKLDFSCEFFKKSENRFYCGSYFSLDRNFEKMKVEVYNLQSNKLSNYQFTMDFPLATTVHPNNYFDPLYFSDDDYLVSDALHYFIKIYRSDQLVDSIKLEDEKLFPKISALDSVAYRRIQSNHLSLTEVTKFNTKMREKCSHIWSVFYLDTTTLLVRVSIPQSGGFAMVDHLWERKDQKWNLARVKEINPYVQQSKDLWPYYSFYNKLFKNRSDLCFVHYAPDTLMLEDFQTEVYFNPKMEETKLHSRIWYFQK